LIAGCLLTKNRKAFYLAYLNICLNIWKGILIFLSLIIIFHLESFPNDLEIKIFDLSKNRVSLPCQCFRWLREAKYEPVRHQKLYFQWLRIAVKSRLSHRKLCFQFSFQNCKNVFPSIFLIFNSAPLVLLHPKQGLDYLLQSINCYKIFAHLKEGSGIHHNSFIIDLISPFTISFLSIKC